MTDYRCGLPDAVAGIISGELFPPTPPLDELLSYSLEDLEESIWLILVKAETLEPLDQALFNQGLDYALYGALFLRQVSLTKQDEAGAYALEEAAKLFASWRLGGEDE